MGLAHTCNNNQCNSGAAPCRACVKENAKSQIINHYNSKLGYNHGYISCHFYVLQRRAIAIAGF
jgi:hypothetical protein